MPNQPLSYVLHWQLISQCAFLVFVLFTHIGQKHIMATANWRTNFKQTQCTLVMTLYECCLGSWGNRFVYTVILADGIYSDVRCMNKINSKNCIEWNSFDNKMNGFVFVLALTLTNQLNMEREKAERPNKRLCKFIQFIITELMALW